MSDATERIDGCELRSLDAQRAPLQPGDVVHLRGQAIVDGKPLKMTVRGVRQREVTVVWLSLDGTLNEADLPPEALRKVE